MDTAMNANNQFFLILIASTNEQNYIHRWC